MNMTTKRLLDRYSLPFLAGWVIRRSFRLLTARMRTLPDFVIIGGQRCGTTSLYNYLREHPLVLPAFMKETHFFDRHYHKGVNWYRGFFPLSMQKQASQRTDQQSFVAGESTPSYLFLPHTPERLAGVIPRAQLIVLLRNPVERAYSHYHHEVSTGAESLSFEDALIRETKVLPGQAEKVWQDPAYQSFAYLHYSYLSRGIYVDQLERWTRPFSREQLLVLKSEDFYRDPEGTLEQVAEFLDLPPWRLRIYKQHNLARYAPMDESTRDRLVAYFKPHNERLYEFLGVNLGWE
jgi:hypothetical protein